MGRKGVPRSCIIEEATVVLTKTSGFGTVADLEIPKAELRSSSDARADIPAPGYRNHWYPALPSDALKKKPLAIHLLGTEAKRQICSTNA